MPLAPPPSLERTHQELLQLMMAVQNLPGKTGSYAEELANHLQPHINREDEVALPLLGLLRTVAKGNLGPRAAQRASSLYSRMKRDYPTMTKEHSMLGRMTARLKRIASEEGHPTAVRLAEALERHVQDEDELLYPAALLVGRLTSSTSRSGS